MATTPPGEAQLRFSATSSYRFPATAILSTRCGPRSPRGWAAEVRARVRSPRPRPARPGRTVSGPPTLPAGRAAPQAGWSARVPARPRSTPERAGAHPRSTPPVLQGNRAAAGTRPERGPASARGSASVDRCQPLPARRRPQWVPAPGPSTPGTPSDPPHFRRRRTPVEGAGPGAASAPAPRSLLPLLRDPPPRPLEPARWRDAGRIEPPVRRPQAPPEAPAGVESRAQSLRRPDRLIRDPTTSSLRAPGASQQRGFVGQLEGAS
jgi:hypothetical protein